MFGIRSLQTKVDADPLQSPRTATAWYGQLPSLDVIARAQQAAQALDAMRQSGVAIDRDRVAAIGWLDAATESDSRRLIAWYIKNQQQSPNVAERFWRAAHELNKALIQAYHAAVDAARLGEEDPRWMAVLPPLIVELMRCHALDAKLRLFRRERWIPAKWVQLHTLFRRATELGIERTAAAPDGSDPLAPERTIEQEYIDVLLIHRLDTGTLTPGELDWACAQLPALGADLTLDAVAWSPDGFYVDLQGAAGLVRRTGNDQGRMVAYLDTTRLAQRVEAALAEAINAPPATTAEEDAARQRHIVILEKILPAIVPRRGSDLRRHPRVAQDVAASICVGLPAICKSIAAEAEEGRASPDVTPAAASAPAGTVARKAFAALRFEETSADTPLPWPGSASDRGTASERAGAAGSASAGTQAANAMAASGMGARTGPAAPALTWRIVDMSEGGWRMMASRVGGPLPVALGSLVAARIDEEGDWMLGVVRRVSASAAGETEAGVSLLADRTVAVTLYAQRPATEGMSVVVNGVETASIGARFPGLYLLPSADGLTVSMRTLIVPASEFTEGRRLILVTARSDYMVVLRHLVDRQLDWSWVTMQIVSRMPRGV